MNTQINTPFWADKSLYLAVLTPLCLLLSRKLGVELNAVEIAGMVVSVVTFIAMNKWKTKSLQEAAMAVGLSAAKDPAAVLNPPK